MPFATDTFEVCAYSAPKGGDTLANTIPWYRARADAPADGNQSYGSVPDECFVRLYDGWRALSTTNRRTILGHEMYHCLHGEWWMRLKFGGGSPVANPQWTEDGLATWAGNQVAPGTYSPESNAPGIYYKVWLDHYKQLPLFQQSYEPFGFWGLIGQQAGADALWARVLGIWQAGADSSTIFDSGTSAQRAQVLDRWGPGLFSQPAWPGGWQQHEPYAVSDPISVDAVVPVSGTVQVATQPYAALKLQIDNTAQRLVETYVDGHGSLTDGARHFEDPHNVWLCLGGELRLPRGPARAHADPAAHRHRPARLRRTGRRPIGDPAHPRRARPLRVLRVGPQAAEWRRWRRIRLHVGLRDLERRSSHPHGGRPLLRLHGRRRVHRAALQDRRPRDPGAPGAGEGQLPGGPALGRHRRRHASGGNAGRRLRAAGQDLREGERPADDPARRRGPAPAGRRDSGLPPGPGAGHLAGRDRGARLVGRQLGHLVPRRALAGPQGLAHRVVRQLRRRRSQRLRHARRAPARRAGVAGQLRQRLQPALPDVRRQLAHPPGRLAVRLRQGKEHALVHEAQLPPPGADGGRAAGSPAAIGDPSLLGRPQRQAPDGLRDRRRRDG